MVSGGIGSKKNRKVGRNANWCKWYAATHRRERNMAKRIKKHLTRFPADLVAVNRLKELAAWVK